MLIKLNFEYTLQVISAIISLAIFAIGKYLDRGPKLVTYLVHASSIPLNIPGQNSSINTHSVVVSNVGGKPATKVRIGHFFLPQSFQVIPDISYTVTGNVNGPAEILIPSIPPKSQVTIAYLYFPPTTFNLINSYAKSDECTATVVNMIPTRQLSAVVRYVLFALVFVGLATLIYLLLRPIVQVTVAS